MTTISKKVKTSSICPTALLTQTQEKEKLCCLFPGSMLEYKNQISTIFAVKLQHLLNQKLYIG